LLRSMSNLFCTFFGRAASFVGFFFIGAGGAVADASDSVGRDAFGVVEMFALVDMFCWVCSADIFGYSEYDIYNI
jgi:hypothetical protein